MFLWFIMLLLIHLHIKGKGRADKGRGEVWTSVGRGALVTEVSDSTGVDDTSGGVRHSNSRHNTQERGGWRRTTKSMKHDNDDDDRLSYDVW
jgi:hypothetical protein